MRTSTSCSSTAIWARSTPGFRANVEQLLATQPSELHALTADLSAGETEALLQRLSYVHDERERAKSPQQFHADLRAVWKQEHELLDQLTALLDDAQRALGEAASSVWRVVAS
jgi:hypothetical protein